MHESKNLNLSILPARNYNKLPDINIGRDVDIVILNKDKALWKKIFIKISQELELKLEHGPEYRYCHQLHLSNRYNHLEIDLLPRFEWRGIEWLSTEEVLSTAQFLKEGILKPAEKHEFFITLNHSYLHGGFFPKKYSKLLIDFLESDKDGITELMNYLYGNADAEKILYLLQEEEYLELNKINKRVRIKCLLRFLAKRPFHMIYRFVLSYLYDFYLKTNFHDKRTNS